MNPQRITVQSKANIQAAERAELVASGQEFMVKLWLSGRTSFVCGKYGPMLYPTSDLARRAFKRLRSDIEPTFFA